MRIEIAHVGLFGWFLSLPPADHMVCVLLFPRLVVSVRVHSGQIADLKRGAEVVVCTPGRMIDILCMQVLARHLHTPHDPYLHAYMPCPLFCDPSRRSPMLLPPMIARYI